MTVYCYHLVDKYGARRDIVVTHDEERVEVEGLLGHRRKAVHFEGKACHLFDWGFENDISVDAFEVDINCQTREARVV